ncbi:Rieske [2Fe-2S] domain-containing protein [Variovorax sp. HW608]|uniref:Rieske 2Fe-2S domain-containing protein n=1 Tax=Variovorax sp. HW608 TaxID=1034889 RepID=UPI00081F89E6|nr:Rieske 2Fe-2S domain-containing protein [Variovorax sp. HW608]SCK29956.1 Rieske [2Fe-2S] domain-containing protein [Variovorax sp. HW608]
MLKHEDNELLVRVGPKTAMGDLMRLYWLPFLLSRDVPADGQPYRVRLLGEDLVAFRDSDGRVGLVDQACPHRGAPLVFARNEEGGLRCVYHGWKFSVDGRCQEMPAEPENTPMLDRVRVKAYPVRERHGVLWAYMGPDEEPPALPDMEWNMVPPENVHVSMRIQDCNWLQALEGEIDSAHAAILHGRVDSGGSIDQWKQAADLAPKFEVVQHDAGVHVASRRKLDEDKNYIRVNQFLMPFWTLVPPFSQFPELSGHAWVPIDDEHTLCIMFSYHPSQPFYEKTRKLFAAGHNGRETGHASDTSFEPRPVTYPYHNYWSKYNRENAYGYAPDLAQKYNAGMPGLWLQDAACQSGVSPIYDRSKENLGVSDSGVARTRRVLLEAVKRLAAESVRPPSAEDPSKFLLRAISITIPAGGDWMAAGSEFMRAEPGKDFGYAP